MAIFGRRRPRTFEGNALASCQRLRPDLKWKRSKSDDQITSGGLTINLGNLRLIWDAKEPAERAAWLEGHLSEVLYQVAEETAGQPPDGDFRAMIRPRVMIESIRLQSMIDNKPLTSIPPYRYLTDDLVGVVGIDSPSSITMLANERLDEWGTDFDSLWNLGVKSIKKLEDEGGWAFVNESVYVSGTEDDYTNARLLDSHYLDRLQLNGPAVALIPHRNSLILAPLIDDGAVGFACDLALQQLNEPSPICVKPFVYSDGELQELMVSPDHPAYRGVSLLRLIDDDINYKQVVPQLAQLVGGDLHIAGFFVDQERLVSSTNWGPSPTLLPAADEVVFLDDEADPTRGMVAPWDAVLANLSAHMVKTDYYPTRYRVEGLPDPNTIRSIAQPLSRLGSF